MSGRYSKMTRDDIILAKVHAKTIDDKDELIDALHHKVQETYAILVALERVEEKNETILKKPLVKLLRKALESYKTGAFNL